MKLHNSTAQIFIPDGSSEEAALKRITHLGIGAHQDDLEFMAFHGILNCFASDDKWFGGVTCTNGAGSSRSGPYAKFTDADMMVIRRQEQNTAAVIGGYAAMCQLDYPSSAIPVAGKTGTAQGRNNFPWNDSSAFTAYSLDDSNPYTVSAYLEKSGYGATAAGPVVKCMFLQMSGIAPADPVELALPLNTDQTFPAAPQKLADTGCFARRS